MLNWILSLAWKTESGAAGVMLEPSSLRRVYFRPSAVPLAGGGAEVRMAALMTGAGGWAAGLGGGGAGGVTATSDAGCARSCGLPVGAFFLEAAAAGLASAGAAA